MDHGHFDDLTHAIAIETRTRRAALRLLAGGALGSLAARLGVREAADAKRKRKKRRKKQQCGGSLPLQCPAPIGDPDGICYPPGTHCCSRANGGGACYIGDDCCPPSVTHPGGSCTIEGELCCSAAEGGGSCPLSSPVCCPPGLFAPAGSCIPTGNRCCPTGGYCAANETCCPPTPGFPFGACASPGFSCPQGLDAQSVARGIAPVQMTEAVSRAGGRRLAADGRQGAPERRGQSAPSPTGTGD